MIKLLKQDYKFIIIGSIIITLQGFSLFFNMEIIKTTSKIFFFGFLTAYCYNQTKFQKDILVITSCIICTIAYFTRFRFFPNNLNYLSFYFLIATVFFIRSYYLFRLLRPKYLKNITPYFFVFLLFFLFFFVIVQIHLGNISESIINFYYGLSLVFFGSLALGSYLKDLSNKNILPLIGISCITIASLGFAIFSSGVIKIILIAIENTLISLGHYFFVLFYILHFRE